MIPADSVATSIAMLQIASTRTLTRLSLYETRIIAYRIGSRHGAGVLVFTK
jgi:hypothetical protein